MKFFKIIFVILLFPTFTIPAQDSPTAQSIITKLESQQNPVYSTIQGTLTLKDRFGTRIITFKSWSQGEDKMLIEFTSDAEFGQKILRLNKDLYLYYPDAQKSIPIRGSALGDSVVGSDMSYEDLTGNKSLLDSYEATLLGTETILDRPCWMVGLKAKNKDVAYDSQTLWIDSELFVTRQTQQFARSGRLLRTMKVLEVKKEGKYQIPTRMILEDQLKRGSSTEFSIQKMDLTSVISPRTFSLQELGN